MEGHSIRPEAIGSGGREGLPERSVSCLPTTGIGPRQTYRCGPVVAKHLGDRFCRTACHDTPDKNGIGVTAR